MNKFLSKSVSNFCKIAFILSVYFFITLLLKSEISALSWYYPEYSVDITINKDTTFNVREFSKLVFTGNLNGLRRDITLKNDLNQRKCESDISFTCGGFEFIKIKSVEVDGKILNDDEYKIYSFTDENGSDYIRIEHRLFPEEKEVFSEEHIWIIDYTVYGGIRELKNYSEEKVPFFYWNLLPENKGSYVELSEININFPSDIVLNKDKTRLLYNKNYILKENKNSYKYSLLNVEDFEPVTFIYEFNKDELYSTGGVLFNLVAPNYEVVKEFNGIIFNDNKNELNYYPIGKFPVKLSKYGYKDLITEVEIKPNQITTFDVVLEPTDWMQFVLNLLELQKFIFVLLVIPAIYLVYKNYKKNGVDLGIIKTITPQFSPYPEVKPYLTGLLINEKVNFKDITSTILDLSIRKFIDIKKEPDKYYTIKINREKDSSELNEIEKKLLNDLFKDSDNFNTKNINGGNLNIVLMLINDTYEESVEKGFFYKNPNIVRNLYISKGVLFVIISIIIFISLTMFITPFTGFMILPLFTLPTFIYGIGLIVFARYMPAKTEIGSKISNHMLGFKMYLETAEKYRIQNLEPNEFVKYLPYAIVLGVEEKWTNTFKNIYKDKFEELDSNPTLMDAYILTNLSNSFVSDISKQLNSNVASGSGWTSLGDSFGEFSGGGGGGGSSGGW